MYEADAEPAGKTRVGGRGRKAVARRVETRQPGGRREARRGDLCPGLRLARPHSDGDPDQAADLTQKILSARPGSRSPASARPPRSRPGSTAWPTTPSWTRGRRPFRIVPMEPAVEATAVASDPPQTRPPKSASRNRLRRAVLALRGAALRRDGALLGRDPRRRNRQSRKG